MTVFHSFSVIGSVQLLCKCPNPSTISASFVAHLSGELYVPIIDARGNFSMHMTVSGDATDVGKSLFQTIWMNVFRNGRGNLLTSITQAQAYDMLADGQNIYGKFARL